MDERGTVGEMRIRRGAEMAQDKAGSAACVRVGTHFWQVAPHTPATTRFKYHSTKT